MKTALLLSVCLAAACALPQRRPAVADGEAKYKLPDGFLFGAGTSSYQTEGAWDKDGKGQNVFDYYYHTTTNTPVNETGDVASDFYGHYKEDIGLAAGLGFNVFRLSLSWARIFPDGKTENPNPLGIQHYHNVLAEMKAKKIEPLVTLFHFDYPQALENEFGGWVSEKMPDRFAEYADFAFKEFGSQVKYWLTVNEASFYCKSLGSFFFPQEPFNTEEKQNLCVKYTILAHAKAYKIYKEKYYKQQGGMVGWGSGPMFSRPASDSEDDVAAAEADNTLDGIALTVDPLVFGDYPEQARGSQIAFTDEEKTLITGAVDFLGINCYGGSTVNASDPDGGDGPPGDGGSGGGPPGDDGGSGGGPPGDGGSGGGGSGGHPGGFGNVESAWVLRVMPLWIKNRYDSTKKLGVFITENGVETDGGSEAINDWDTRAVYSSAFIREMVAGIHENGTHVIGYTAWSLLDTFEFKNGWSNWGLVHVDFGSETLTRSLKASSTFFKTMMRTGYVPLVEEGSEPFPDPDATTTSGPNSSKAPETTTGAPSTTPKSGVATLHSSILTSIVTAVVALTIIQ